MDVDMEQKKGSLSSSSLSTALFSNLEVEDLVVSWKFQQSSQFGNNNNSNSNYYSDLSLIDFVLSWSIQNILDQKLYAQKIKIIPETFVSLEDYAEAYIFSLLEETRAELCSSLEAVSAAPFAEIIAINESKNDSKLCYFIDVGQWKRQSGIGIPEPSPGDLLVLSTIIPMAAEDLQNSQTYLAAVTDVSLLSTFPKRLTIEVSKSVKAVEGIAKPLYAIFLSSSTANDRIRNALCFRANLDNNNLNMIEEALHAKPLGKGTCSTYCFDGMEAPNFCRESIFLTLNKSQKGAIVNALTNIQSHRPYSFNLIWSPPGTGRTKTVCVLLWLLLDMGRRTVCVSRNIAVVKICSHLLSIVKDYRGQDNGSIVSSCSLGDIVLFGVKDQVLIDGDIHLQEICLEHRVKKLAKCFSPSSGWMHLVLSLISLLENCVPMYRSYLEDPKTQEGMSLKEFVRKSLNAIVQPLRGCMRLLSVHLTKAYISERVLGSMVALLSLLNNFNCMLCTEDVSDKELEELFSQEVTGGECLLHTGVFHGPCSAFENIARLSLDKTRSECLRVLRALKDSPDLPHAVSKDRIKELCLRNATLILCSASDSSALQYYGLEPFEVLVIDEASSLKESESVISLRVEGIRHAILIGDEHQVLPAVKSKVSDAARFGRSLFERLLLLGHEKYLLDTQYSMHPEISKFPISMFYDGLLVDSPKVRHATYEWHYLEGPMYGPYSFINIIDGREERDEVSSSWKNMVEVAVVIKIIRSLFKSWTSKEESLSIGIMSPYTAQINAIQMRIANEYKEFNGFDLEVKSIDEFRGSKMDIIIISTVRCNDKGKVGLLSNLNRTNVALTRARHCLWILGHASTLLSSKSIWREVISDIKKRGLVFNAVDDKGLEKPILQVKNELKQLEMITPDSVLLSKALWKVSLSNDFLQSFAKLKYLQTKQMVVKLLLKLSEGWHPKRKGLDLSDSLGLVKQCRVSDLYVIWTVDIEMDENYIQVLKVWDIVPGTKIPSLVKRLDEIIAMYTDVYIEHCRKRCIDGKLEVPMSWNPQKVINRYTEQCTPEHMENCKVKESLLLLKFYSLSSGVVNHLLTDNEGKEIDVPFELSDQEKEVVRFPRSAFILGRSGTGKTTALSMKLIQREQHYHMSWNGLYDENAYYSAHVSKENGLGKDLASNENFLRQVFITVNPRLCAAIRNQIQRLRSLCSRQGSYVGPSSGDMYEIDDSATEFRDIPNSFIDIPNRHYPLVITFKKFLMMLDGTMPKSFFRKFSSSQKFPKDKGIISNSLAFREFLRSKEVTYERFAESYWHRFDSKLTKNLHPLTVFTEIISHIKGGVDVTNANDGKVGQDEYIKLSNRRLSALDSKQREGIYEIFLRYEKRKVKKNEFDMCDIVNDLHQQLSVEGFPGNKADFIYIDEVQDLTMRQIALFRHVCNNFQEGFAFAGDTAQTISRGINFRFEDIRCLFFKEFLSESSVRCKMGMNKKDVRPSEILHLSQNFRSHDGVLMLAQSIMDLLIHFFPSSVDKLGRESSLIHGEAPVIINNENAIATIFKGTSSGEISGFGAEQVILVRDDCDKKEILDRIGGKALVLTILECKGLEFQDVLLYKFFDHSPFGSNWCIVYEYRHENNIIDSKSSSRFDAAKHSLLCSELKQLYVAVTRTRQRLWICDSDDEVSKPMFDYWRLLGLVQLRELDSSFAHTMKAESGAEVWRSRGIKLFDAGNFDMATLCFEHAGDELWQGWARAAAYQSAGERMLFKNLKQAREALEQAAKIYQSLGKTKAAANCFVILKEYKRAGEMYLDISSFVEAGECFDMAGFWNLAADVYARGKYLSKCLSVCIERRLFSLGLQFLAKWKQDSTLAAVYNSEEVDCLRTSFLMRCACSYLKLGTTDRKLFVGAFQSMDVIRKFLNTRNLIDILLEVEFDSGNYVEAAEIARSRGHLLREADAFVKLGEFREASRLIILHVIMNSLWAHGSKGWPLKQFPQKLDLLMKAKSLAAKVSDDFYQSVCDEVIILSDDTETSLSSVLLQRSGAQRVQNNRLELFAARRLLDIHLKLDPSEFHYDYETGQEFSKQTEEMLFFKRTSVETLICTWDLWKKRIMNVLSYLQLRRRNRRTESSLDADFCMTYFGVRRLGKENTFTVLNSKAYWCKVTDGNSLKQPQNMVQMNIHQFASRARNFCSKELISVGIRLLNKLYSLHEFCYIDSLPLSCHGQVLIHIFNVARFLKESKFLDMKDPAEREITSSAERGIRSFLAFVERGFRSFLALLVFPIEFDEGTRKIMVAMRENEISKDTLEAILGNDLNQMNHCLTHDLIGWIVMLLFVSGRPKDNFYEKIEVRLNQMLPWKSFIEQLKTCLDSGFERRALVCKFKEALESTYQDVWRKCGYMSPHCFMYLFECLVFLASSCLQRGSFYTTKSTLFEMATCDVWNSSFIFHLADPHADGESVKLITEGEWNAFFVINSVLTTWSNKENDEILPKRKVFEGNHTECGEIDGGSDTQRQSQEEEIADQVVDGKGLDTIIAEVKAKIAGVLAEVTEGESPENRDDDEQVPKERQPQLKFCHMEYKNPKMAHEESSTRTEYQFNVNEVFQFLSKTAWELLIKKEITKEWAETMPSVATTSFYPLFLSRLVVAISLVHLNWGRDLSQIVKLLCSNEVLQDLPKEFSERLRMLEPDAMRIGGQFLRVVAEASNAVGHSLMLVKEVKQKPEQTRRDDSDIPTNNPQKVGLSSETKNV